VRLKLVFFKTTERASLGEKCAAGITFLGGEGVTQEEVAGGTANFQHWKAAEVAAAEGEKLKR